MKRFITILAVMALMAAMLAASAMPAFAQGPQDSDQPPHCEFGNDTAFFAANVTLVRAPEATDSLNKNLRGSPEKNPNAAYCLKGEQAE